MNHLNSLSELVALLKSMRILPLVSLGAKMLVYNFEKGV